MSGSFSIPSIPSFFMALLILSSTASCGGLPTPVQDDVDSAAATALCERLLGRSRASSFEFRTVAPAEDSLDFFRLSSRDGKIIVEGSGVNPMAVGLNYYLKHKCNVSLGFYRPGKIRLPSRLPVMETPVEVSAVCRDRFFLNYCTYGYSMPWWGWDEWEYFIDWMALNGVNMPLSITGQESVWYRVWTEMGLSDEDVRSYFTGPAHLPWHRMSNIDEWDGPLPKSWLDGQEKLQKKIVARERELGMRTVLPAFAGHVPEKLAELYPDSKIDRLGYWGGFSEEEICSFLDPTDPLFGAIQKSFLQKQTELYGTDHIYGIDLFNEVTPPSWEPDYLAMVGEHVYGTLAAADPQAVWLQMTWLFYHKSADWTEERIKSFITSYPAESSILLDYYCDRTEVWRRTDRFSGVPFIWCYLGNFGGNTFLTGDLPLISGRIADSFAQCGNMTGIGSTLEGLDACNFVMYDYLFEQAWDTPGPRDVHSFVEAFADRRCGAVYEDARKAWTILADSVYSSAYSVPGQCVKVNVRPVFGPHRTSWSHTGVSYANSSLLEAIRLLLRAGSRTDSYEYDLVNLTRQWLGNAFEDLFDEYSSACASGSLDVMDSLSARMTDLISDMDRLLSCRSEFLLGKWISDARGWGCDDEERTYFERNARNLITTWGRPGTSLNDYANRSLAGLTSSFYGVRWKMFFDSVRQAVSEKGSFDEGDYAVFEASVVAFEGDWWADCVGRFPSRPSGDVRKVVSSILSDWEEL